jgi:hypothetical protein
MSVKTRAKNSKVKVLAFWDYTLEEISREFERVDLFRAINLIPVSNSLDYRH